MSHFDLTSKRFKVEELTDLTMQETFWSDPNAAQKTIRRLNAMKEIVDAYDQLDTYLTSLEENDEVLKEYFTNETILSEELSAKAKIIEDIIEISMELYSGDVTQVLDQNGCLYLIQCINRIDYDYIPYEEVVDNVKKALREEHYDDIVAKRAEGLKVIKDDNNVYNFTKNNIK